MKRVLGYCAPWSVRPGQRLEVKASVLEGEDYQADVVRVVCGCGLPGGPPLDLRPAPAPINGAHTGKRQETHIGSAVAAQVAGSLTPGGFRLRLWPTLLGKRQALIGWRDEAAGKGALMALEPDGRVSLSLDGVKLTAARPLKTRQWVQITARFGGAAVLEVSGEIARMEAPAPSFPRHLPLVIAAIADPAGGRAMRAHFNGKIEAPLLLDGNGDVLAAWDFSRDHDSDFVHDAGPHGLHGRTINLPARAVTSSGWTGGVHDWRFAREQYAAIHFHDDDLYDAGWDTSLAFDIPSDWPSGYYAVRLRSGGDESWAPFFVTPPPGKPGAKLAVIASTATSIAYANQSFHMRVQDEEAFLGRLPVLTREDVFLRQTPWLGLSHYDTHADGSGVRFSSRLRPVLNMGPFTDAWNLNADTMLYAWLDMLGEPFDIITDEDLHTHGAALLGGYRCVIAGSHPEYYSTPMRQGLETYLNTGGRLLYLGGNGFYWRVAFSPHFPGAVELRRAEGGARYWAETPGEAHMAFTGELGGLWRRIGGTPQSLVGVGMCAIGFDGAGWYEMQPGARDPRAAFLMEGLKDVARFGETGALGSAAGEELDRADAALGTPEHALIIASSAGHTGFMQLVPEETMMPHLALSGAHNPDVRADAVFFETPGGGAVFSAGSMTWTASLFQDAAVARMTENALRRFLDPQSFETPG